MNKHILIFGICILIWSSLGCINDKPYTLYTLSIPDEIVCTVIEKGGSMTQYTGVLIEQSDSENYTDFILIEDGEVVSCSYMEKNNVNFSEMNNFTLKDGNTHFKYKIK